MTDLEQQLTDHLRRRAAAATPRYDLEGIERASGLVSLVDLDDHRAPRLGRRAIVGLVAVAAAAAVVAIAVVTIPSDTSTVSTPSDTSTVSISVLPPAGGPAFAAAIEAAGVLTSPSAEEVEQAMDDSLYRPTGQAEVTVAGHRVSLRSCQPWAASTCGTGFAYVTRTADRADEHGGLLGVASYLELHPLDDRYIVASEGFVQTAPGVVEAPSKTWLIDAVSGKAGTLSWRDEPTTMNSPAQALLWWGDDTPHVVDARDGTIRPLAVPDDVEARLSVARHSTGRIWVGTDPGGEGRGLGLAYSDDGGATWIDVALPEQVRSTSIAPDTSADPDLRIAADGDRVAVVAWWGTERSAVYVSDDAGRSWTTATYAEPGEGNRAELSVLADGQLVLKWFLDARPQSRFVSTGSDWAKLEKVDRP
jgi:hypothetical protein